MNNKIFIFNVVFLKKEVLESSFEIFIHEDLLIQIQTLIDFIIKM